MILVRCLGHSSGLAAAMAFRPILRLLSATGTRATIVHHVYRNGATSFQGTVASAQPRVLDSHVTRRAGTGFEIVRVSQQLNLLFGRFDKPPLNRSSG